MKDGLCDLHLHTVFSDGLLTPETSVRRARELGLVAIAITDHDAVPGIEPARRAAASLGLEVVPGIEMSCIQQRRDIHILGYYIDYQHPELLAFLGRVQQKRLERARKIVGNLNQQGLKLEFDRVLQIAAGGALGRPHIAQALLERGLVRTTDEAFVRFIGYHSPAYVPKMELTPGTAIAFIKKYGGIPVAAHPGSYDNEELLNSMIAEGLQGIEVYHPDHNQARTERYLEIAIKNNLFITGGSDCHGGRKGRLFIGEVTVPYRYLAEMKRARGLK